MIQTYIFSYIHPAEGHFHKSKAFNFKAIILSNTEQNMQNQRFLGNKNSTKAKGKEQACTTSFLHMYQDIDVKKVKVANYFVSAGVFSKLHVSTTFLLCTF